VAIDFKPNKKQYEALEYLNDNTTTEVLYGGAAHGGKSYFGCAFIIMGALKYPESRWLIGRAKLNTLKTTTLLSFYEVLKHWNLSQRFKTNNQTNIIYCDNGSEIHLKDLFYYPSDPEMNSLGSSAYTGMFIDEIAQVSDKVYDILKTRIRYKHEEFKIKGKCLSSCNPSKGWVYKMFYKPWVDGTLPEYRKYVHALPTDNPFTTQDYVDTLNRSSEATRQRLLLGNWDYSDDVDSLFKYPDILRMKEKAELKPSVKYITADIARLGKDKTVIMVWDGLHIIDIIQLEQVTTNISASKIQELQEKYNILPKNIIVDADGIGGGVIDQLRGVTSFINNSKAIYRNGEPNIYANLKSQCFYRLAEFIEKGTIKISCPVSSENFELICQELQAIRQKDIDTDGKLAVIPKDLMKKILGHSPDFADCIMMRMYHEMGSLKYNPSMAKIYRMN
jgi:phage terminase large subunit